VRDEARILEVLTSDAVDGLIEFNCWSVLPILSSAARGGYLALIDVGALITGLSNAGAHAVLCAIISSLACQVLQLCFLAWAHPVFCGFVAEGLA
jgi:hypothetical protein